VAVIYLGQAANAAVSLIRGTGPEPPRSPESTGPI
jgi:hypothetical protein